MKKRSRKRVTLKRTVAVHRLEQILILVEENLRIAIEIESVMEEANAIVKALPRKNFFGAQTYNVIKQCLTLELAIALARLFDSGRKWKKRNKSDVASVPLLIHFLKQKRCRDVLLERARHWTPGSRDLNAADCTKAIEDALNSYLSVARSIGGRKALANLKDFRNVKLAHSLIGRLLEKLPTYDDLFLLVHVARNFTTSAKLAITGVNIDFAEIGQLRRDEAEVFWRVALTALRERDACKPPTCSA